MVTTSVNILLQAMETSKPKDTLLKLGPEEAHITDQAAVNRKGTASAVGL